ncbi:SH3 domain-containing protein [Streptococcus orisratti]|uniref:SH3 domain-containing protein n=1 Tax=Streptococcus orisratti TaxID=114652 RepID=UPI0023F95613|nr:SH3 domain-containing protein [Streptococcus orisratti]
MVTVQDAINHAISLIGQKVTVPSNPYGGQCVAFDDHETRWATGGRFNLSYTNAIDLLSKARANGFEVFYNNGQNVPQPGDWWVTSTTAHPYGHTGMFLTTGGQPVTLEQNVDGNADALFNGGWVRKKQRLLYANGRMTYSYMDDGQTLIGWFRLPLDKQKMVTKEPTAEQIKRRKSGMYGSFYFTVTEGDGEFVKGAIYLFNAATNVVTGMHNQDELKAVTDMYKARYGEDMKSETYSIKGPWHRRLFAALQTRTTGYGTTNEAIDKKVSGLENEVKSLASLVKGNDIAQKESFTASVNLNIRETASKAGKVVGMLKKGEAVEIVGAAQAEGFYWVSFLKNGQLVYVASKIVGGDTYGTVK